MNKAELIKILENIVHKRDRQVKGERIEGI